MNILVTNDDGVSAPGLLALVQAIQPLGDISILAPDRNWSGGGHVKTIDRPLRIKEIILQDGIRAYAGDGAPSDCVALALLGFFEHKFDLVVSGINPMPNLGHDVTYSGTVTAATEAVIWGVPGIAFSLGSVENGLAVNDYAAAAEIARQVVLTWQERSLPGNFTQREYPYAADGSDQRILGNPSGVARLSRSPGPACGSPRATLLLDCRRITDRNPRT